MQTFGVGKHHVVNIIVSIDIPMGMVWIWDAPTNSLEYFFLLGKKKWTLV
jgi:hypothetical protein